MKRSQARPIGQLVREYLREESLESPLNQYRLVNSWAAVMGPGIALYTRGLSIKNQTLFVQITSSALRQELMMRRSRLVDKLNEYVGAQVITNIVFR
ncbi:MAG: DUF721 domain-containing protein [Prevotellaceae bacterium]|nr:DUF721 domain-containing protein [Prevotellaceae bacterium]